MPIYEYVCKDCDEVRVEAKSPDHRDVLPECKICGKPTKRLYSSVGVSFRGSGFYSTDK